MKWNLRASSCGRGFRTFHVEVYDYGLLAAADDHSLARLVPPCVDLLMRHVRRDIDEIARAGFIAELKTIAPAHASAALHYVKYGFEFAMVMRSGFCIGLNYDGTCPKPGGSGARACDSRGPSHAWSLWSVRVQFARPYYLDPVILPVC